MSVPLPPLRDIIERHGLAARKSLGQHFLLDLNITRKIVREAQVHEGDHVLEIGPGPGGLTRALLEAGARVTAIERDSRCLAALEEINAAFPGKLTVMNDDALVIEERDLPGVNGPIKIVSNLPYNISTELLIKWLKAGPALWSLMTLMFQKEVADRITSAPGPKTYGRLSVISQAASAPRRGFDLPARAFTPPPKVDSSVLVFEPPREPPGDLTALERVTQAAFSQRRKMLRSSLKSVFGASTEDHLIATALKPTMRAEEVTVDQYRTLAKIAQDI